MSEPKELSEQRLSALYRYISALEQGDPESLAVVLHEAEGDAKLNALLKEMDTVYQTLDGTLVTHTEALQALQSVIGPQNLLTQPLQAQRLDDKRYVNEAKSMKKQTLLSSPEKQNHFQQRKRFSRGSLPLLAALLVVALLIGATGWLLRLRSTYTTLTNTPPPHAIVVAIAGGNYISSNALSQRYVYGLRPDTGALLWTFSVPTEQDGIATLDESIIVGGTNVYVLASSQVYALNASDGKLLWHTSLFIKGTRQDSYNTFLFDQNMLYVGGYIVKSGGILQDKLFALQARNGSISWHYDYPPSTSSSPLLAAQNGIVYVASNDSFPNHLRALRGSDGKQLWAISGKPIAVVADDTSAYVVFAHPTTANNPGTQNNDKNVFPRGAEGALTALNTHNGQVRWSNAVGLSISGDALQISQGRLFYGYGTQICSWSTDNGHQFWCNTFFSQNSGMTTMGYKVFNNSLYIFGSTLHTSTGTTAAVSQSTGTHSSLIQRDTLVFAYSTNDEKQLQWKASLNDWNAGSGTIAAISGPLFIKTNRSIYGLDAGGHLLWSFQDPLPGQAPPQFSANEFEGIAQGSW